MRSMAVSIACLFAVIVGFQLHAFAQVGTSRPTSTWVGPDGGRWSNPNNWSPVGVPAPDTNASISTTVPLSIVADYDYSGSESGLWELDVTGPITFSGTNATIQCFIGEINATIESGNFIIWEGGLGGVIRGGTIQGYSGIGLGNVDIESGAEIFQGPAGRVGIDGVVNMDGGLVACEDTGAYVSGGGVLNLNTGGIRAVDFENHGIVNNYGGQNVQGFFSMDGTASQTAAYNVFSTGGLGVSVYPEEGGESASIGDYATFNELGGSVGLQADVYGLPTLSIGGQTGNSIYHLYAGSLSVPSLYIGTNRSGVPASPSTGPGFFVQDGGATTVTESYILAGSDAYLNGGSFTGPISNSGLLKINSSVVLAIAQLNELAGAELELTGLAPSATAMIGTTQDSALAGELAIELADGYSPAAGDVLDLIDSPSLSGVFDNYDLPVLGGGLAWEPVHTATNFSLRVVPEPAMMAMGFLAMGFLTRRRAARTQS